MDDYPDLQLSGTFGGKWQPQLLGRKEIECGGEPAARSFGEYAVNNRAHFPDGSKKKNSDGFAVIVDPVTGVTMVDVSDLAEPIDRQTLARVGDPVLVCFGPHEGRACATGAGSIRGGEHGVVFETAGNRDSEAQFLLQFRRLVRPDCPVRVESRSPMGRESAIAGGSPTTE